MEINSKKEFFLNRALREIPRIIASLDRNPLSETFGCFDVNYWVLKKKKSASVFNQFSLLPLALAYNLEEDRNDFHKNKNLLAWIIGGIQYTIQLQNKNGSWNKATLADEFYNNTTPQILYALAETLLILDKKIPDIIKNKTEKAILKATDFLSSQEVDIKGFAHHYAQRALALWKVYQLMGEEALKQKYHRTWIQFLSFHNHEEGWSKELQGFDPTAQTITISTLAKIYKDSGDRQVKKVIKECIDFTSYFVYPDGFFGGSTGVLNFYDSFIYGYELLGKEYPRAAEISKHLTEGFLKENKTFSNSSSLGEIAVNATEYLLAFNDVCEVKGKDHLPFESLPYTYYFKYADVYSCVKKDHFVIANLKKGGTLKIYNVKTGKLIHNDDGIIAMTDANKQLCSNYIVNNYAFNAKKEFWEVGGKLVELNDGAWKINKNNRSNIKQKLSSLLKKLFAIKEAPVYFKRRFDINSNQITITDTIKLLDKRTKIQRIHNHIPFSYKSSFIIKHLAEDNDYLSFQEIDELNAKREITKKVLVDL